MDTKVSPWTPMTETAFTVRIFLAGRGARCGSWPGLTLSTSWRGCGHGSDRLGGTAAVGPQDLELSRHTVRRGEVHRAAAAGVGLLLQQGLVEPCGVHRVPLARRVLQTLLDDVHRGVEAAVPQCGRRAWMCLLVGGQELLCV